MIKDNLMNDDYFLLTYGDGLSDVKISEVNRIKRVVSWRLLSLSA